MIRAKRRRLSYSPTTTTIMRAGHGTWRGRGTALSKFIPRNCRLPKGCRAHPRAHARHVAFFRRSDRVLISGDAVLTVGLASPIDLVLRRPVISGPPWYGTWDRSRAKRSVALLACLEPLVVAGGHGFPATGSLLMLGLSRLKPPRLDD